MKIETMLPLGKLDPGLHAAEAPLDIGAVAADARRAEALGYDGVLAAETKDDPYIVMALAAQTTERVELAAVNPYMCQVAGEVADGIRAHPIATPRYIAETMLPAVRKGAAKAGRDLSRFTMCVMPLVATAPDRASLAERIRDVRARVA